MTSSAQSQDEQGGDGFDLFAEPADYRPSTPPPHTVRLPYDFSGTSSTTALSSSKDRQGESTEELTIHLLGSHPLWGHHLWNACLDISRYLQTYAATLVKSKCVLELGAAAGVPSIVCAREGADVVVASDYPDEHLVEVLGKNLTTNTSASSNQKIVSQGFLWGASSDAVKAHLPNGSPGFDLVLLSDLLFNHQAHGALFDSLDACLAPGNSTPSVSPSAPTQDPSQLYAHDEVNAAFPDGLEHGDFTITAPATPCALVFFTHHRPHKADRDIAFFQMARDRGWVVERIGRWRREVS